MVDIKQLSNFNLLAATIHFIFCMGWIVLSKTEKVSVGLNMYENRIAFCGVNGNKSIECKENEIAYVTNKKVDSGIKLETLLILFFGITSFFHIFYFIDYKNLYSDAINNKNNFFRWIEYSITATMMMIIIARSSGVNDTSAMDMIIGSTICIMIQGQLTEMALNSKDDDDKIKTRLFIYNAVGWGLMVAIFFIIGKTYLRTLDDVEELICKNSDDPEDCTEDIIPEFVKYIIIFQFFFYSVFGFVQLYQIYCKFYGTYDQAKYNQIELIYIILSLLSKTVLGATLGFGILQARNRDNNDEDDEDDEDDE